MKLSEEVVDPNDIEMLEDLIVAATNEALRQVEEASQASILLDFHMNIFLCIEKGINIVLYLIF